MLRPERMSKVSVTGSKRVMDDVIEATHELNLLHVTEYDGSWSGFEPGAPEPVAEDASDKLVTVRSLESILGVDEEDAGRRRVIDDEDLEAELAEVRDRVNELDDQREDIRNGLRTAEEKLEAAEPFTRLGIDLDLLSGYDSLQVAVGEGDPEAVRRALADAEAFDAFEVFASDDGNVLAAFAYPADGASDDDLTDALVGVEFAALEVPDAEGAPEEYVAELEAHKSRLEGRLNTVEEQLDDVKAEAAGFILAAEEELSIEVQKAEAPLSFATTANAFVAEGWLPSERYEAFATHVDEAVDGRVEVERLEEASFGADGTEKLREEFPDQGPGGAGQPAAADGGDAGDADAGRAATDGGTGVVMRDDDPPVVQDNPDVMRPFELFVKAVGRPKYWEFDPTVILFLTFPAFFGFMIGDVGYGLIYVAIGYYLYTGFESEGFRSMGGITIFAGVFTLLFGFLYGELFGLHFISELGAHPPMEKGLQPAGIAWAQGWLVLSLLVGVLHLDVGYAFDFFENLEMHDLKHAVTESGSWLLMMNGLWIWILSRSAADAKPAFLYTVFDGKGTPPEASGEFAHAAFELGFNGLSPTVGLVGLGLFIVGLGLLVVGEPVEVVEFLQVLVNVLSYTRIAAVLLAKAGMAFTVNLLFFGAYQHDGEFHFMLDHGPAYVAGEYGAEAIMFPGLVHSGVAALLVGLLVLVFGHALVLALGVTSAGLQAIRLEYVEFFGKFYEGGGKAYEPFGAERRFTAEE